MEYDSNTIPNRINKLLNEIATKDKLLVTGYFRKYASNENIIVPPSIVNYCIVYTFLHLMVFDSFGLDTKRMEIINPWEVKCLVTFNSKDSSYGSSVRLKYAMPIASNNDNNIASISWEITPSQTVSFPNAYYFIGVVSNKVKDFSLNSYFGLRDNFGINGNPNQVHVGSKKYIFDYRYQGYKRNSKIRVEYSLIDSSLTYYQDTNTRFYSMELPTKYKGITHWYPCISLRDSGDVCKLSKNVIISYK